MTLELAILALWLIGNGLIIWYALQEQLKLAAAGLYLALTFAVLAIPDGPLMWIPVAVWVATALRAGYLLRRRQTAQVTR